MTKDEYMDIYNVVGAAMKVHEVLGRGLEEAIYQEALDIEMRKRGLKPEREKRIDCYYEGTKLNKHYVADFYFNELQKPGFVTGGCFITARKPFNTVTFSGGPG